MFLTEKFANICRKTNHKSFALNKWIMRSFVELLTLCV